MLMNVTNADVSISSPNKRHKSTSDLASPGEYVSLRTDNAKEQRCVSASVDYLNKELVEVEGTIHGCHSTGPVENNATS